jgi:hypothetical protein
MIALRDDRKKISRRAGHADEGSIPLNSLYYCIPFNYDLDVPNC